jgi:diacylglycerol kinase family enzyme
VKVAVILNESAGRTATSPEEVERTLAEAGIAAEVMVCGGDRLCEAARAAAATGVDAVVAAGGDGTVSAVAQALVGGDVPLAVLPLGTLNHFARDLGVPVDLAEASRAIAAARADRVDVGEVNGRYFVNNSSIGLYPEIVLDRDAQRRRTGRGKWRAMIAAAWRVLRRFPLLALRVVASGRAIVARTPLLFVGNNEYQINLLQLGQRTRLDGGHLGLYMLRCRGRLRMFGLMMRAILQRLDQVRDFEAELVDEARVDLRRPRVNVALDGEVAPMRPPLTYRILPRALPVLRPAR